ncbi:tetratricopeptide repeat protein [Novosphingobium guangzhouense]|uniref:Sporulation protein n=1 Tax=Novosphingobium guangzhouense TaxID=1850347 RepID=A0A2K2FW44_9SPHN|nr:SPOR domain-containing protein [Novosphingobium guangzhouense]PNU02992.1 sporulation protein [Novosphingobium guangzhouense]
MKNRHSSSARNAGFTLCSAMVAALLAGCAGGQHGVASTGGGTGVGRVPAGQVAGIGEGVNDTALARVEARVAKSPRDMAARAALAQGYLAAGRFDSAATTFEDALALGDRSPRTGLSLALAYIGSGRQAEALDVLQRFADRLPAGDYGLAVALAGQPAQGVEVLSQAVRKGENTAKTRQNLAYAYALDGRWAEARVVASQDVTGEELDARLQDWASKAGAQQGRARVAGLLGTPLRADQGQPAALALNGIDHTPRAMMAAAEPVAPLAELPAVEEAASTPAAAPVLAEAVTPVVPDPVVPAPAMQEEAPRRSIERAFAGSIARVQKPQPQPVKAVAKAAPKVASPVQTGSHLVQLGSFSTMEGARRAWTIFQRRDPSLRDHALRITEADVNGRRYYRVAAEGFARGPAQSLCSTVKGRGGECLAYEDGRALPGTVAPHGRPMLASR